MLRKLFFCVVIAFTSWLTLLSASPITIPLTPEGEIDNVIPPYFASKKLPKEYHKMSPNQSYAVLELDLDLHDSCSLDFRHQWSVHTGSAIYSTPVIFPKGDKSDMKNIFVASYFNFIEVIQGDGYRPAGWPLAFEDSTFQTSPLVFDIDNDGNTDIGVVDRDANLFWIRTGEFGTYLEDYHIQVPKLRILKNWYDAVKDNFSGSYVMISMFDRYQTPAYLRADTPSPSRSPALRKNATAKHAKLDPLTSQYLSSSIRVNGRKRSSEPVLPPSGDGTRRRLLAEEGENGEFESGEVHNEEEADFYIDHGEHGHYRPETENEPNGEESGEEFNVDLSEAPFGEEGAAPEGEIMEEHDADGLPFYTFQGAESTYGVQGRRVRNGADDGISYYMSRRQFEDNEEATNEKFINVDPHVLATPAMGDINGDGHMEIIFPVSYYFDSQDYQSVPLPEGLDTDMYVASGLVCWDMQAQEWTWTVHLDLSTAKSKFQGLMYASPTIADLDGDKRMEVIVGTSMGMLYIVDGESGFVRHNFPLQLHSIQAQVAVADITGGFEMEMIVGDMGGNLAVLNVHGEVLWDRQLSGTLPYTATIGDVDGDGQLDVVIVSVIESTITRAKPSRKSKSSTTGLQGDEKQEKPETETIRRVRSHVWALRGDTGETLPGFPIALPQEETISGPILLLHDYAMLTRYIEAQQLQQEENTLMGLLNRLQKGKFFTTTTAKNNTTATKTTEEKPTRQTEFERDLEAERDRIQAMHDAHDIAKASDRLFELKEHSISSGSTLGTLEENDGVYMLIPSFQGHVYVVAVAYDTVLKKRDFCMQKLDIGSPIAASPLLEDVTGDGYLDLVIATLPGEILVYETNMPRHAGNIWDSFPRHHRRSFSTGDLIVSIPEQERQRLQKLESRGNPMITVDFDIMDLRCSSVGSGGVMHSSVLKNKRDCTNGERSYTVTMTRGKSNTIQEPLWTNVYNAPGHYQAKFPLQGPDTLTLLIAVTTEHGLYSEDSVSMAISTHFYVWLKYFILLPVIAFCLLSLGRLPTNLMNLWSSMKRNSLAGNSIRR